MEEKVAVVTGSNKGIGFAVVKGLCKQFKGVVYLTSRDESRGLDAVKRLKDIGLNPEFHILDVTNRESIKNFADFLQNKHGGLDVLVNNAAILDWNEIYPSYEAAKRNIDTNYRSLIDIEEFLYPLLRINARVVNISSACGHLANLQNEEWKQTLKSKDLTIEQLNNFVDNYLESVRNGTFEQRNFSDDGKHAEHRVSKIGLNALTFIQQRKYRDFSINAIYPGHVKTDMAHGGGQIEPDEAAKNILYLILETSQSLKGVFMWSNGILVDWTETEKDKSKFHYVFDK